MKKLFGVEAEINITADEDIVKGIGGGIKNGSIVVADIIKELKPIAIEGVKTEVDKLKKSEKSDGKLKKILTEFSEIIKKIGEES